ncbi:uridine kinase family protein [Actinomycetota bacterium]
MSDDDVRDDDRRDDDMTAPTTTSWQALDDEALGARLRALLPDGRSLVLVDGGSGAGKSTVAARIARALGGEVVHTDAIAWHLDIVDWDDELVEGVLEPWRAGEPVSYRPPGWIAKGRPGAVTVPVTDVLVVEGVGAGRARLAALADVVVWVHSDPAAARRRGVERDIEVEGRTRQEAEDFWDDWALTEVPFLERERPWTRAHLVVNGTPDATAGPGTAGAGTRPVLLREGPTHPGRTGA